MGTNERGQWTSRLGFVLAAAGSAVGLGNIWKFPYITGENGGGLFVLIYLVCIVLVGVPVMVAEVLIGRAAQRAPVGAFKAIAGAGSMWKLVGWLGVIAGFVILSYYSVVAGWSMHYVYLSASGAFNGATPEAIGATFGEVYSSAGINLFWHAAFMIATMSIVVLGVSRGIERAMKVLMPVLFVLMGVLLVDAFLQPGFGAAFRFLFYPNVEKLTGAGILEALGHSFFTLSLGMGAMITYGSYLEQRTNIGEASVLISLLDTGVALAACLILFPITFSFGMGAEAGPGLVFKSVPIALSQMFGGQWLSVVFFVLLFFAALSSGVSLLEVVASTLIDQKGWSRKRAVLTLGVAIALMGVPSALSGASVFFGETWSGVFGKNWFDSFDYLASNWFLPLGALFISLFAGWAMPEEMRRSELGQGRLYSVWLFLVRYLAPVAIAIVFVNLAFFSGD